MRINLMCAKLDIPDVKSIRFEFSWISENLSKGMLVFCFSYEIGSVSTYCPFSASTVQIGNKVFAVSS